MESLPVHSYQGYVILKPIEYHQLTWEIMATSTYGDLCPCSRMVGMMLRNLSAWEVRITPRTVTSNVQMAEIFPNMKALKHTSQVSSSKEQKEPSQVSQPTCSNSPKKELTMPTPISLQLGLGVPVSECDVLNKVDHLGCTEWEPEDQQEVRKNLKRVCGCLC